VSLAWIVDDNEMTEREAFTEAIAANPQDDTLRLIFADWLQEHGEEDRAEYIRLACEMAARRGELGDSWSHGGEGKKSQAHLHELFKLRGSLWFASFYHALGVEEIPPSPASSGWTSRLWRRLRQERRQTFHYIQCSQGKWAEDGGNGPVWHTTLDRGLVDYLGLDFESPFPVRDITTAFQLEPVNNLAIRFGPNSAQWNRLNLSCLRRVAHLALLMPTGHGLKSEAVFDELIRSENWSGVRSLHLLSPMADRRLVPSGYVDQLSRSPLLAQTQSIVAAIHFDDLPALTTRAARLSELRLWSSSLPPRGADLVAAAVFRPNLEILDLSSNYDFGDEGVRRLVSVAWPRLTSLCLPHNTISDAGVQYLLPLVPQLSELYLSGNTLTDTGALMLAEAIDPAKLVALWLPYTLLSSTVVATLRERFGERFHFHTRDDIIRNPSEWLRRERL